MHPGHILKRLLHSTLFILISVWLLLSVLLYVFQSRFVYLPSRPVELTPADIEIPYEEINFTAKDNTRLHGWFVPHENSRGTLLFLHGNAGNISHRLTSITLFRELGLSVFIFDYRGYGKSEGKPTEDGTYMDADAAWNYLHHERKIPPEKLVIFGRSMGGAIAARLATHRPSAGIILESTFSSVDDMARHYYPYLPTRWLTRIKYPTFEHIGNIAAPLLLIHSPEDEIVPFEQGEKLFEHASHPKSFLQITGDHNYGFIESESVYLEGIENFLSQYLKHGLTGDR